MKKLGLLLMLLSLGLFTIGCAEKPKPATPATDSGAKEAPAEGDKMPEGDAGPEEGTKAPAEEGGAGEATPGEPAPPAENEEK